MQNQTKLGMAFGMMAILSGCESIEGKFTAHDTFEAVNKWGKTFTVHAGSYDTKLWLLSKKTFKVRIRDVEGRKDQVIKVTIPPGKSVPSEEGTFALQSSEIGQPFDISGTVNTDRQETAPRDEREHCSRSFTKTVCRRRCETVTVTLDGYRDVTYHNLTTTKYISMEFSGNRGEFTGKDSGVQRIYDYYGDCILY